MRILPHDNETGKRQDPAPWAGETWREKKSDAEKIALRLSMLTEKSRTYRARAERMAGCAHYIQTLSCPDGHHHRVTRANLCKDRLCPVCGWRRARALAARTDAITRAVQGRYLLLTLTIRNPEDGQLGRAMRRMTTAFGRMMRAPRLRGVVGGAIRTVEVTRNRGTWHPHIHALVRVEESYFRSALYVHENEWLQLWRDAYGDQTITQVDIRATDIGIPGAADRGAIAEVAKYVSKSADIMRLTLDQLHELACAIKGLRLWSASGCLKISEADVEAEMIHACDEGEKITHCPECGAVLQKIDHEWHDENYRRCAYIVNWPEKKVGGAAREKIKKRRRGADRRAPKREANR